MATSETEADAAPATACGTTRGQSGKDWRPVPLASLPGPWRAWCEYCQERAEKAGVDDPAELTDTVLRRTGCGSTSRSGKVVHLPAGALEEADGS